MSIQALRTILAVLVGACLLVACGVAALPTPIPTPTPPPGLSLADLEGWWTSSKSMSQTWHIAADGVVDMFHETPATIRLIRPATQLQLSLSEGSVEILQVGGRARSYANDACDQAETGLYAVDLLSPDAFQFTLSQDPCEGRVSTYDGAKFTRAHPLEQVLGEWHSETERNIRLTVSNDLRYRMERGASPGAAPLLEGTLFWDAAYQRLQLQGVSTSPCGPTKKGMYTSTIGDDGKMSFESVEDLCAERRQAMEEWSPFVQD